ncbi:hypothetical protein HZC30_07105 [Candidatus Woesearchaeota archaeon]|nr:hypothetical protein [Candidatus Woesearchaeota archaeon]
MVKMAKLSLGMMIVLTVIILAPMALSATLKGSIYNTKLELETDTLVTINTQPEQKYLSKDGNYQFEVSPGKYTLTAQKIDEETSEEVEIVKEGEYVLDLFLIGGLGDEEDLWSDTEQELDTDVVMDTADNSWVYWLVGIGVLLVVAGVIWWWLKKGKKKPIVHIKKEAEASPAEETKSIKELKEELAAEPGYLDETIALIKRYGGRIYQKELRKEMLHLSESKISLILTELEHKGRIEKIKKGRGNAIILKG